MSSLKSIAPALARCLGTTPALLYERQRALVESGRLKSDRSRGPGKGVQTSLENLALLVLATMASERLSTVESRIKELSRMRPSKGNVCPFTQQRTFLSAIESVLDPNSALRDRVKEVSVSRLGARAYIRYRGKTKIVRSNFGDSSTPLRDNLDVISGESVLQISRLLSGE